MAEKLLAALNKFKLSDDADADARPSAGAAEGHVDARKDRRSYSSSCETCQLKFNSEEQLEQHLKGKRHSRSAHRVKQEVEMSEKVIIGGVPQTALEALGETSDPVTKALIGNITGTLPRKRVLETIRCSICCLDFNDRGQYQMHLDGKKHAKKQKLVDHIMSPPAALQAAMASPIPTADGDGGDAEVKDAEDRVVSADGLKCLVCSISVNSRQMMNVHLLGNKHKMKLRKMDKSLPATTVPTDAGDPAADNTLEVKSEGPAELHCKVCNVYTNSSQQWLQHVQSKKHKDKSNPKPNPPPSGRGAAKSGMSWRGTGKGRGRGKINFVRASDESGYGWLGGRGAGGSFDSYNYDSHYSPYDKTYHQHSQTNIHPQTSKTKDDSNATPGATHHATPAFASQYQPPSMYRVTPPINSTFVKGSTLRSNTYY